MRGRSAAFAVFLALACNEVLGLDPGKLMAEGGGGGGFAGSRGEGGSTPAPGNGSGRGGSSSGTGNASNGDGGDGGVPCSTTVDCIERGQAWPPYLCLAGACVDVLTEECDTLLGAEWLEDHPQDQPIVFGALADNVDELSASYWSLELAMREFAEHGPIPIDGIPQRPLLLLCRGSASDPDSMSIRRRLDHLLDEVGVPGIVMIQSLAERLASIEYALTQKEADAFFMDVGMTSELLSIIPDDGRVWHMLGDADGFGPLFYPLVRLVEEHVNPGASNGNGARLTRLVMIPPVENDGFESEMARSVEAGVFLNDRLMVANPDTYQKVIVRDGPITAAIETADLRPDIVIDFAGIYDLIDRYVGQRGVSRAPFYILPPSQVGSPVLRERVASSPHLQTRVLGVGHAGPDEEHEPLYDAYLERLAAIAPPEVDGSTSANVYEAVYFLAYAAVAGGTGGSNMNTGMTRLIDLVTDARRDIGPTTIDSVLDLLRSSESLSLHGALGPPSFIPQSGGRSMPASVWCIDENLEYVMDALHLVPGEVILQDLVGPFPCFFL